jgi:hypothetical protein
MGVSSSGNKLEKTFSHEGEV